MKIITDLTSFKEELGTFQTAICIGNFDGLHQGHQEVIRLMVSQAREKDLLPVVLTFQSNTRRWKDTVCLLSSFDEKVARIRQWGVDILLTLPFPGYIAALSPMVFVREVLSQKMGMKACFIGDNFRFGKDRKGTPDFLKQCADKMNFEVSIQEMLKRDNICISSSMIRILVNQGKTEEVTYLLGRPYELEGLVVKGHGRGQKMGFPTANILPLDSLKCIPADGLYLTSATWNNKKYLSLTHIGPQPTFHSMRSSIETHILDFGQNMYGRNLKISFLQKLRQTQTCQSIEELTQLIHEDIETARSIANSNPFVASFLRS